jgi:hypothetical protein
VTDRVLEDLGDGFPMMAVQTSGFRVTAAHRLQTRRQWVASRGQGTRVSTTLSGSEGAAEADLAPALKYGDHEVGGADGADEEGDGAEAEEEVVPWR